MLKAVIDASLSNRVVVLVLALFVAWGGVLAVRSMPLEAIPDLSDVQVIVQTDVPGQNPRIVEDQVTYPIASELLKVPGARTVRAFSFFESSFVYVIFDDGTDLYWARSRVLEVLSSLRGRLPAGAEPTLGPDATGLGWVYQYALVDETGTRSLAELRAYQDWTLRYQLAAVPGVSEVATVGGYEQVYEVQVDPAKLRAYGIPVTRVMDALRGSNEDAGAMVLEMAEREYMIRGLGYLQGLDDIGRVVVSASERGAPVRVSDVATVRLAPDVRRGVADLDGLGEVVGGIVVMRFGENALATIERVKEKVASLEGSLPEGLAIRPVYDRSDLILRAVATLREKLVEESLVVALVVVLFLFHLRSSLVILLTLPLGILIAFIAMRALGLSADIMSLGGIAIAIGAMIDAAIVMVENLHKHLERAIGEKRAAAGASADPRPLHTDELTGEERWALVGRAAKEVGPALFFTLLVITVSFLPVFALEAQEGRLFKPLAWTKTLAMAGAAFVSITVVPVAMGLLVRGRIQREDSNPLNRVLIAGYLPVLRFVLRWRWPVAAAALAAVILTVLPARRIGSEFMPPLDEGTLLYMPTTLPGIGVAKAASTLRMQDSILASFPEVESVFGKAGRAETATDPAPLDMFETTLVLKPRNTWRPGMTPDSLVAEMDAAVRTAGVVNSWTMPIQGRIDMLATGIRTPVGVKIFGPDLATLERLAREVEEAVRMVPGTRSAFGERVQSGSYVDIEIDRDAAARYGLNVGQIQAVITSAIGGMALTTAVEGRERYAVRVRYPQELRDTPERLAEVLVPVGERRAAPQPGAGLAAGPIPGGPGLGGAPGGGRAGTDGGAGGGGGMAGMASGGMGGASSGGMGGLAGSAGAAGAAMGGAIPSALPGTPQIPLGMVARIRTVAGPMAIKTEQAFPTAWVTIDTDARDLGAYVAAAQDMVDEMVTLPAGYSLAWSGQYEAMERARERMAVVIPATLLIIFMLLYMSFGRLGETLIVLLSLPFALVGGVLFMAWMGFNWSVATAVGFIALAGVAAETGVVMLLYLDHAWRARLEAGKRTLEDLREAVLEGAALRLRPKMMTVLTVVTGLLPLYWGDGTGASVMRRIAAPMVGGMVSALVLTLVVIPALYSLWMEVRLAREARHGSGSEPGRGRG